MQLVRSIGFVSVQEACVPGQEIDFCEQEASEPKIRRTIVPAKGAYASSISMAHHACADNKSRLLFQRSNVLASDASFLHFRS
jgi:hypothetical protein